MDYTSKSLDEIPGIDRGTTSAQELAHPIIFLSGVQHFAETPDGKATVPEYIKDTVKKIPAAWDESQYVDGYPGECVIIARRSDDTWFIAGINGDEKVKLLSLTFHSWKVQQKHYLSQMVMSDYHSTVQNLIYPRKPLKLWR